MYQEINASSLPLLEPLRVGIYHESGEVLHTKGESLTPAHLAALKVAHIETVFLVDGFSEIGNFVRTHRNHLIPVDKLEPGKTLAQPIYDEQTRLLLKENLPISQALIDSLKSRNILNVQIRRTEEERHSAQASLYLNEKAKIDGAKISPEKLRIREDKIIQDVAKALTEDNLELQLKAIKEVVPMGEALAQAVKAPPPTQKREEEIKIAYLGVQKKIFDDSKVFFDNLRQYDKIDGIAIGDIARRIILALVEDQTLLLNLVHLEKPDYLVCHSMNMALLSANIATGMGLDADQVMEVALAGFLADIGMIKVDPKLLKKEGTLSVTERLEIEKHAIFGIDILRKVTGIPWEAAFVAYQAHERMDGSGYPKGKEGHRIHPYARIVAIADTFDAMITYRDFRRGSVHPFQAMDAIRRMTQRKRFDPAAFAAFERCMGRYPIGSWVQLETEEVCKVTGVNPETPDRPVLYVFEAGKTLRFESGTRLDLKDVQDVKIARLISPPAGAADVMHGF